MRTLFQTAWLQLTLWYLIILMSVSISFSIALYQVSLRELIHNQSQQERLLQDSFYLDQLPGFARFNQVRAQQLAESRTHLKLNLLYFNGAILLAGGVICYLLARRTLEPIEEAMESQRRFTADASHELRTPLTAMKSELEVALRDKSLTLSESKELHKSTLEEIDDLEALSSGLLELARYDNATEHSHTWSEAEPSTLIESVASKFKEKAAHKNISLETKPTPGLITADAWVLTEILTIFLDNALKYSPENSRIIISNDFRSRGTHAILQVQDFGIGIPAEELETIFSRFYRVDHSRHREGATIPGYGLGLSIAKKIADSHRGSIEVTSSLGQGSTFTFIIPSHQPTTVFPPLASRIISFIKHKIGRHTHADNRESNQG